MVMSGIKWTIHAYSVLIFAFCCTVTAFKEYAEATLVFGRWTKTCSCEYEQWRQCLNRQLDSENLTMEIRKVTVILCSFLLLTVGDMGEGEIECYFCEGDAKNSTCANTNTTDFDQNPDVRVGMCRRGMCVKWTRRKNGTMWLERTCTYAMQNFHLIVSDDCRKEKFGNGFICMCGRDKCNSGFSMNSGYRTLTTVTISVIISVKALCGFT